MFLDEHCKDCMTLLGTAHLDVHLFLDKMCKEFPIQIFGEYHRTFLHNTYGLTIIQHKMGEEAYKAGLIHLYADHTEAMVRHLKLETVLKRAKKIMPWWDNCQFMDATTLETVGGL